MSLYLNQATREPIKLLLEKMGHQNQINEDVMEALGITIPDEALNIRTTIMFLCDILWF